MPYNVAVLKELASQGFFITVLHNTERTLTPFSPPLIENVSFLQNETISRKQLTEMALALRPCLVYVSDRTIAKYNYTAVVLRKKLQIPVISGFDSQWRGGKQWINVLTSWFRHKRFFSHVLIAGMRQFEYAKRLGFRNDRILWPLNSANIEIFLKIPINQNRFIGKRNFIFVGRFAKVKGLEVLLKAWADITEKNGSTLTLIGNGPLKDQLRYPPDVIIHDFMNQDSLAEVASQASCFILPSTFEPWALVIHEFAAAGLPLIVTSACGAAPHFVINNFNGFIVKPNHVSELKDAIEKIIRISDDKLQTFSLRSRELSKGITSKMVAYAITSILDQPL
jgi:glycosyltransferase involved in cell wall biosynthesis